MIPRKHHSITCEEIKVEEGAADGVSLINRVEVGPVFPNAVINKSSSGDSPNGNSIYRSAPRENEQIGNSNFCMTEIQKSETCLITDLVFKVKVEREDKLEVTRELVGSFSSRFSGLREESSQVVKLESESVFSDNRGNYAGRKDVGSGSTSSLFVAENGQTEGRTCNPSARSHERALNPQYSPGCVKLKNCSVRVHDLFSSTVRRLGKAHSSNASCLCVYCRGEYKVSNDHTALSLSANNTKSLKCNECPSKFNRKVSSLGRHSSKQDSVQVVKLENEPTSTFEGTSPSTFEKTFPRDVSLSVSADARQLLSRPEEQLSSNSEGVLNVHYNFNSKKLQECSVSLQDLFSNKLHRLGKAHSNGLICFCKYCQGKNISIGENSLPLLRTNQRIQHAVCTESQRSNCKIKRTKSNLAHLKHNHNHTESFKCELRPKTFRQVGLLRSHFGVHEGPYSCAHCPAVYKSKCRLKDHVLIHTNSAVEWYECEPCGKKFVKKSKLRKHMVSHNGERSFECKQRSSKLKTPDCLKTHLRTHSLETPFRCEQCFATFKSKEILKAHAGTHSAERPFECEQCPAKFKLRQSLKRYLLKHSSKKLFQCKLCPAEFKWPASLHRHCNVHHRKIERSYECPHCCAKFFTTGNLRSHMRIHNGEKRFECEVCSTKFKLKKHLIVHMRRHTGEKPYICKLCPSKFGQSGALNIHMRRHTGEKPYICKLCPSKFRHSGALDIHMRQHTGEKPYVCKLCPSKFRQSGDLKIHMRRHTGEKPYSCKLCPAEFCVSSSLTIHMRLHTGEKPYSCKLCPAKFSVSSNLTIHMRLHTGEKPFHCKLCPAKFKQTQHLSRHMKRHTGEKPFHCKLCSSKFARSSTLTIHMRQHTGAKPFSCKECPA